MYSVSEKYSKAIVADTRDMPYRVKLAGVVVLDQSKIPNMKLTESASGASSISIGTANSASLNLTLRDADVIDYNEILVEPESGLVLPDGSIEWVPLGKFWVTNSSTSNDYRTVTLTCADGMYYMTGEYESELTYPTTIKAVVNEILAKTGFNFSGFDSLPHVIVRVKPDKMTYRDAIGYAAGCCGKNARFNREGNLEFYWYSDTGVTIEREAQYLNGMTRLNDKPLAIDFEITGKQETYTVTCVSDGSGGITATPGQNVLEDDTVVLTINPFAGYELATISAITDSGASVTLYKDAEGGYTFVQPDSNVTVTASFRQSAEGPFTLTVRAYDGGHIRASGTSFNKDASPAIYVKATSGYEFDRFVTTPAGLVLDSLGTNANDEAIYEFTMPQSDVTISAYFKEADTYYTIERIVDQSGLPTTPGYVVIENLTTPGSYYKAGDIISVLFARTQGHVFDYYEANVDMVQIDSDEFQFTMPANNVSITAHFKWEEDASKEDQYSWLALPAHNTPPTPKPYWAAFYRYIPSEPMCKRFYLVWFDSWSATDYNSDGYGKRLYSVEINGYYYCGSKDTWHYPHAWDTSTWSGNGASGSTLSWDVFVGGYAWAGDAEYSGDYCLLATNAHLYYNNTQIFQACPNAIKFSTEGYVIDGMDVRERGALGYYKCPDTFSTPAPASNWMILNSQDSLLMNVDEDGNYNGYSDGWSGLYVVWFDAIAVENVGAVFDNSDEEFYIATVTNGYCAALCRESGTWGGLHEIGANQVIGIRNPTISENASYSMLGTYYFNGLVACSRDISSSGELLRYKNDCKICDCTTKFMLRRSATTNAKSVKMTYTNPLIYEKMVPTISDLVQGITYTPARVKHRGNPAFQPGDILTVPDRNGDYHTVLIMQQTMTFGGGMNSEFTSFGQTENQSSFSANGPITTQIKREVKQANADLEHRISASNALVFASLHRTLGSTESKIQSMVEWQTESAASIAELEQTARTQDASIKSLVAWQGNLNVANSNIIKNSSGINYPDISSNTLMINSTNFIVSLGKIESNALTVTEDENTVYVTSDNIVWGDGTFYATPRTDRVEQSTNYTVSFEAIPDENVSSISVYWFSDTEENRKAGCEYVNSIEVGTVTELYSDDLQLITLTFKTNSNDFTGYLKFVANGGEFKISKIKMELGSAYTGWIPYGEDTLRSVASMEQKVNQNEATIKLQADISTQLSYSVSKIEERVTANEAKIELEAQHIKDNFATKAELTATANSLGGRIDLKVSSDDVTSEFVIAAINGEGTAKISADRIDIEGKKLNIKVDATNIEGKLTADQLCVTDLSALGARIGPLNITAYGLDSIDTNGSGVRVFSGGITSSYVEDDGSSLKILRYASLEDGQFVYEVLGSDISNEVKIMTIKNGSMTRGVYVNTATNAIWIK